MTKAEILKQIEAVQVEHINNKEAASKASTAYKKTQKKLADLYKQHFEAK